MATVSSNDDVLLGWVPDRRPRIRIDVVQFTKRLLQDCLTKATGAYWWRRANEFESARPKPGDHPGLASPEEIAERDGRLAATADACRLKATTQGRGWEDDDISDAIEELFEENRGPA